MKCSLPSCPGQVLHVGSVWPALYWWPVLLENWAALPQIAHGLLVLSHLGSGHRKWVFSRAFTSAQSSAPQGPLQRSGLEVLHTLCPGLPLCCAEVLLGVMKAGANHAGTTKTTPGLCVLPQKSLIPLVTPVNLFPQQACTRSCSCPKETCGRTSGSERLSNSVHNCRDMSIISNSLCRKGKLFFPSDHVATESGHPVQIL